MNKYQYLVQKQFLNNEEVVLKRLKSVYNQAAKDVNAKIEQLQLDIDGLTELWTDFEGSAEEKAQLQSRIQSKIYQKQYQTAIQRQIDDVLKNLQNNAYKTISEYLDECYTDGYIGAFFDLHGQGIPLIMPLDQEAMVRAVQLDSKISEGLYNHLGENYNMLKKHITAQVSRGLANGFTFAQVAQQLTFKMSGTYNNPGGALAYAMRIARTEGHRIQVQGAMDACYKAKDMGADVVKQWDATLDGRTRASHARVDGEIKELDEKFSNGLMFPGDPSGKAAEVINCRCALLERARWALDDSFTKMNNFTKEIETFESPAKYDEFKKAFFSKENRQFMNYHAELEERYGTKNFEKLLGSMTDDEYEHWQKLYNNSPMYNKAADSPLLEYKPAKTIDEATEIAKGLGVKYVRYDKLPLETANNMNKALLTLPDEARPLFIGDSKTLEAYWGGSLPRTSKSYYGVTIRTHDGIHLGYGNGWVDTDGYMVGISSSYKTSAKITEAKARAQAIYKEKHNGQKWFFNENGETTAFHEMGHIYANTKGIPDGFEQAAERWAKESGCDMIEKTSEAWAEAWAAYYTKNPELPDYISKYIDEIATKSVKSGKKGLISFDDDGIIFQKKNKFKKDFTEGKISTLTSPQKLARHIKGSKQFNEYVETLKVKGKDNLPSYFREDLTTDNLKEIVVKRLQGNVHVNSDGSYVEFVMCDDVIGYYYSPAKGEYIATKCVQVKYSLGSRNIHFFPVKERMAYDD